MGAIATLASVGSIGLLLAIIGTYTTLLAAALGLPIAGLATFALHRTLPPGGTTRAAHLAGAAALILAVSYGAFAGATPSQNLILARDPGSYAATGRWLARDGALEVDARSDAFAGVRDLRFVGAAVYDVGEPLPASGVAGAEQEIRDSGQIEFQFNHLAAVALAAGYDVGGYQLMFRLPALMSALSLLAVYAVALRMVRRPFIALLAPTLLAAALPFLYVARNTYSESFAAVLLWGGVLVLAGLHERPRVAAGATGGLMLGAVVCARVDALLYVGMVIPLAALSVAMAAEPAMRWARARAWLGVLVVTALVSAIGWYDLAERSGFYNRDLGPQLSLLRMALVGSLLASAIGLALWLGFAPVRRLAERLRRPAAAGAAAVVVLALLFGWLVRPHIQTATSEAIFPAVETIQRQDGLPIDPDRNYAEDSLRWMAWYLGSPALAAAIGAMGWATWRALRRGVTPPTIGLLVLCLGAGALYWYDPNITPDHLWATRRFVPATFPALAVWATAGVAALAGHERIARLTSHRPAAAWATLGVTALVLLVPPALTTKPVRNHRIQPGYLQPVLDACETVGDDGAILMIGGYGPITLAQSLRSWCGVPVASAGSSLTPERVDELTDILAGRGFRLHLVSPDLGGLDGYLEPGGAAPVSTTAMSDAYTSEQTLDRPPSRYLDPSAVLPIPTPFALHILDPG